MPLVLPPRAMTQVIAFSNALSVMMSRDLMFFLTRFTSASTVSEQSCTRFNRLV